MFYNVFSVCALGNRSHCQLEKPPLITFMCIFMGARETCLGHQYSLLQQPLRRQIQMQMQQIRTRATNPDAPATKIVMFKGSGRRGFYIDIFVHCVCVSKL